MGSQRKRADPIKYIDSSDTHAFNTNNKTPKIIILPTIYLTTESVSERFLSYHFFIRPPFSKTPNWKQLNEIAQTPKKHGAALTD